MNIKLTPEQERIIQAEIDSGHFRNPDEVLDHALAQKNLAQFLLESPLAGAELNLARQDDFGRPSQIAGECLGPRRR